jgi:hypothetical protein
LIGAKEANMELSRHDAKPLGEIAAQSVCEHLAEDHRRLPKVLSQTEWRVQQRLFPGAEKCFAEFRNGLEVHLGTEERIASAVLGPIVGANLSAQIQACHEILRRMVANAAEAIQARDCESFASIMSDLRGTLVAHTDQEEHRLFPLVEQLNRAGEGDVNPAPPPKSAT